MLRLRYGGRFASWLALIALAIQLAVSFGHVHLDGVRRTDSVAAIVARQAHTAQSLPSSTGDKDDYCAICASIYQVANSFVPPPPLLPVPPLSTGLDHVDRGAAIFVSTRRLAFQSRAPPFA